jgi:hypothetical protein
LTNKMRDLIIMRPAYLNGLNELNVKKLLGLYQFDLQITKRIKYGFRYDLFCDVVIPVNFQRHWVLKMSKFEHREITVVHIKKDTGYQPIDALYQIGSKIVKESFKRRLRF